MRKLNFGFGVDYREGYDNADSQKCADISFDFNKFPYPIKDNTYDYVYASCILEHLDSPKDVLNELWKICKPNARIEIIVPYYNNKSAYSEIEHKWFFSDTTFFDFVKQRSKMEKEIKFEIVKLELPPTKIGKFMPKKFREKLSLFMGGIISHVHVVLKVIKKENEK